MRMISQNYFIELSRVRLALTDKLELIQKPSKIVPPQIIIYKHMEGELYERKVETYSGSFYDELEIRLYCLMKSLPIVLNFSMESLPRLAEVETVVWLMLDKESPENQKALDEFTQVAKKYEAYRTWENIKNRHIFGRIQFVVISNALENTYVYRLYLGSFPKSYPTILTTFQRSSALNALKFIYNEVIIIKKS